MSTEWMNKGDCRNEDPDLFFPIGEGVAAQPDIAKAKAICYGCPVQRDCLAYALHNRRIVGVWGGTTDNERITARRRMRRQAVGL